MKKPLLLIFIVCIQLVTAQTPNWAWAHGTGGNIGIVNQDNGTTWGNCVATDINGNVYSAGFFQTPIMVIGNYTLTNSSNSGTNSNAFIVKHDAVGNVLWAKSATGNNSNGLGLVVDAANNIYVTGGFSGATITLDNNTVNNANVGTDDIFIVKFNGAGNVIWVKAFGGIGDEFGNAITIDANNNFFITGNFKSRPLSVGTYSITTDSIGKQNMFIAKFDSSGNPLFAKTVGKSCVISTVGTNVVIDLNNNFFVTGSFSSSKIIIANDTLVNKGNNDLFVIKYNSSGNELWARSAAGSNYDEANSIAIDANGNPVITGYFSSPSFKIGIDTLKNILFGYNTFIAKYNAQGNVIWAKNTGALNSSSIIPGPCIATGLNNSVYVAGGFFNPVNGLPPLVIANDTLNNNNPGLGAVLLAKYDSSGNAIWGKTAASLKQNEANSITTDKYGNIYIVGCYDSPTIIFDNDTLYNFNNNQWTSDYFIAKIGTAGVGIEKYSITDNVIIYPNPSNGNITIGSANNLDYIKVTDMLGQIVYETKSFTNKTTLQINNAGIYFVTATSGKEVITKRVIVNK